MYYKQLAVTGDAYTSDNMKFPEEAPSGIYEVGVVVTGNSMTAIVTAFGVSDSFGKFNLPVAAINMANYPLTYVSTLNGYYPMGPELYAGQTYGLYLLTKKAASQVISCKFYVKHTKNFAEDVFNVELNGGAGAVSITADVSWYVKQISE